MVQSIPQVVLLTSATVSLPMMLVLFIISKTYSSTVKGLTDCGLSIFMMLLVVPLLMGRGIINDFYSIIVANVLLIAGFVQMLIGLQKLANRPTVSRLHFLGTICLSLILFSWFTYVDENTSARVITFSTMTGIALFASLYLSYKFLPKSSGKNVLLTALTLILMSRIIRIGAVILGLDHPTGVFDYSLPQMLLLGVPALTVPLLTISFIMIASDKIKIRIEHENQIDDLTNTLNRKAGLKELAKEFNRSKRHKSKLVTMFIDLDTFKEINDRYGHLGGDQVLIDLANKATTCLRQTDILFRYGGDEFVAILPLTDIQQAILAAERIHEEAAKSQPIPWTVSIGIAELTSEHDTIEDLLTRTDNALYQAKLSGKNKTVIS